MPFQVGGYLEEYTDFTFTTVRRAGHEAPYTGTCGVQPAGTGRRVASREPWQPRMRISGGRPCS